MQLCDFAANINVSIENRTIAEVESKIHGRFFIYNDFTIWAYGNKEVQLNVGDTLYYWLISLVREPTNDYRIVLYESVQNYELLITDKHMINRTRIM